jgi:hypothetical protein
MTRQTSSSTPSSIAPEEARSAMILDTTPEEEARLAMIFGTTKCLFTCVYFRLVILSMDVMLCMHVMNIVKFL